jgi:hypothetical protein
MAWTTPRTYVAGEVVTASILNVDVRDNLNALKDKHREIVALRTVAKAVTNQAWQDAGQFDTEVSDDWAGFNPPNSFVALPSFRSQVFATIDLNGQTGAVNAALRIVRCNSVGTPQQYCGWHGPISVVNNVTVVKLATSAFIYSAAGDIVALEFYVEATGAAGTLSYATLSVADYGF